MSQNRKTSFNNLKNTLNKSLSQIDQMIDSNKLIKGETRNKLKN